MQVIQFKRFGDPSQLHLAERPQLKANATLDTPMSWRAKGHEDAWF